MTATPSRPPAASAACRSCRHRPLVQVLDLGAHPEANTFPGPDGAAGIEPRWPLRVSVCGACWLVQLDDSGPEEAALPGPPPYDLSETMRGHAQRFVEDVLAHQARRPGDLRVVELASHGAYLHPFLAKRGVRSLIVEGSPLLADAAGRKGYPVVGRPFGPATARELVDDGGPADLVIDNYLLAHVTDPDDFAAGLQVILKPGGVAVLEFAHVLALVTDHAFDSLRHGHFSYLGLISLSHLLERHGLAVFDLAVQPVYGGALRVFVAHAGDSTHRVAAAVGDMRTAERRGGLRRMTTYGQFARGVRDIRTELRGFLEACRERGEVVVGYGAPSRASTLLNYCGITTDLIAYTVDRSGLKHDHLLPGCGIPIEDPSEILRTKPAYVLVLTWDISDEVRRQMAGITEWGGRFVIPLPRLAVLS